MIKFVIYFDIFKIIHRIFVSVFKICAFALKNGTKVTKHIRRTFDIKNVFLLKKKTI